MLYAKAIYTSANANYPRSASDRQSVFCGERFDFDVILDDASTAPNVNSSGPQAWMTITRGNTTERVQLFGDVWVMNESGKTISQFAVPLGVLTADPGFPM